MAVDLGSDDPVDQNHKVMQNFKQLIGEAGGKMEHMCKVVVYITDMANQKPCIAPWGNTSKASARCPLAFVLSPWHAHGLNDLYRQYARHDWPTGKVCRSRNRGFRQGFVFANHSRPLSIAFQYTHGRTDFFKIHAALRGFVLSHGKLGMTFPP